MKQESINELRFVQRQLSSIHDQIQQFKRQLLEVDSALSELSDDSSAYEIVGTVMIKKSGSELIKSLEEKKSFALARKESFEKQELEIRKKVEDMQKELLSKLDNDQ
jgi:prefoldin beta subunit